MRDSTSQLGTGERKEVERRWGWGKVEAEEMKSKIDICRGVEAYKRMLIEFTMILVLD